jgi:hypothetical protein
VNTVFMVRTTSLLSRWLRTPGRGPQDQTNQLNAATGSIDRPTERIFLTSHASVVFTFGNRRIYVWQLPWVRRLLNHLLSTQMIEALQSTVPSVPANIPWFANCRIIAAVRTPSTVIKNTQPIIMKRVAETGRIQPNLLFADMTNEGYLTTRVFPSRCTINRAISAGVMPLIRLAWERSAGCTRWNFSRASLRNWLSRP